MISIHFFALNLDININDMVKDKEIVTFPRTLDEFQTWEPNDGFKYEWNDGELIKFTGINKK